MEKLRKDLEKARSLVKESADRVDWQLAKHRLYKVSDQITEILGFFKKEKMKKEEVIITINKGIVHVHTLPEGIKIKIVDFDTEGLEEDQLEKFEGRDALIDDCTTTE